MNVSLDVEPFYFKSYGRTIGVARNVGDLREELGRLAEENPDAVAYHLRQGHIVRWLEYANQKELAEQLRNVEKVDEARLMVDRYLENSKLRARTEELMTHTHKSHHRRTH